MATLQPLLLVALGGALGALARHLVALGTYRLAGPAFPLATLLVNVSGCFVIGLLLLPGIDTLPPLAPNARLFLVTGILGGFTTFSSFGYETVALAAAGSIVPATANILLNLLLGLAAVVAGRTVGLWWRW